MSFRRGSSARGAVACLMVSLGACSILPQPEQLDVYLLPAKNRALTAETTSRNWSLLLNRPEAGGQLAGQRILVIPEANRVSVYGGASWHEPIPLLLRNRLLAALRADRRIAALATDDMHVRTDFELASDLTAFHSEYVQGRTAPEAVIRLDVRLVDSVNRRIIASRLFEARGQAVDTRVPEVVKAFGAATDQLVDAVADWAVSKGDEAMRLGAGLGR